MIERYQLSNAACWHGRVDGTAPAYQRWHQVVRLLNLNAPVSGLAGAFVLLGFACDEGVRRNEGRPGAAQGPEAIRSVLRNLPVHHGPEVILYDAGDITCEDGNLEAAQEQLAVAVGTILKGKGFPVVLGGGHEVVYGHFKGIRERGHNKGITGIINFDAHFDLRAPGAAGVSSGTGFYQIAGELGLQQQALAYFSVGIQRVSNTPQLFQTAAALGVPHIEANAICPEHLPALQQQLQQFINKVDELYLTIDMDVFAAPYAPGVSATAFNGIEPGHCFQTLFKQVYGSPKLISFDIAELNPAFDIDQRTAKLAADLIFRLVSDHDR
ncbi:formimidoylglutamase [Niabella sp. CC-SYL272]|uniref:formimidoylglutamase n=1 Tax=Niabella agricola TaxID=2891571 RepID=UPI001F4891BB|nr:formimidoylglutamase [Niabella agricola]MCF3108912.1 formimidoylglutamase [Niabella agricola]